MLNKNTAGGAGASVAAQLPPCPHCKAVWHRRDCPLPALPPTETIIRWEDRLLPPRTEFCCTMNCSPRHGDCDDCAPVQIHDDAVAARDSEISELRTIVTRLTAARSIEPDYAFRARVADLFHLTQFYPFVSKADEVQAMKAAQDIKAMLARPLASRDQSWRAIGPALVQRDEHGWWSHPAIPNFDEDHRAFQAWTKAVGLEIKCKTLESSPEHPLYDAWFERGECDASSWEPGAPPGEGWFDFSIHDTEDGPVWVWARRIEPKVAP